MTTEVWQVLYRPRKSDQSQKDPHNQHFEVSVCSACSYNNVHNKWKNNLNRDVGISRHDKEREQEDAHTKTESYS